MKIFLTIILAVTTFVSANAYTFTYSFDGTPLSEAIVRISKDHPEINISFIYKELDNYDTSARIATDDAYEALRSLVGLNPVSVIKKDDSFYIEALQHGRFRYTGRAVGTGNEPIASAVVMLLSPKDSTVVTYGITDDAGRFAIPCDRQGVIAKLTCLGYKPAYRMCSTFDVGTVQMTELPIQLKTVTVEGANASLLSDKSVYRPTQRQKNASQTAVDLLARMAIPQLFARLGSSSVSTASGQPVAIYIDYVPASEDDLKMMRISDVNSVEYLEYPADPRFQGNKNVINFRMTRYEYGGYVKALGTENFIANSGFLQANARLVRKKMSYDIMGYSYYISNDHFSTDQTETYRLPQENGEIKSFKRESLTETSRYRRRNYETSFRALYSGDKITANTQVAVGLDDTPHNDNSGLVRYTDNILAISDYSTISDSKAKYLKFSGYYYFGLPKNSSMTASVSYSYSHTNQSSLYSESNLEHIYNGAKDNTHDGGMKLNYSKSFSDKHSMMAYVRGIYEHNRTNYAGSLDALDYSTTKYGQIGTSYNFSDTKFSASLGFGWCWLATKLNDNRAKSDYPYLDASLRFLPNRKNSFSAVFHYSVWPPSSNYKSENIIRISPFLWHTGNPFLQSSRSYDVGVSYTFIPSNRFSMTTFANSWLTGNRAAFVYEATPEGIIRKIQQPIGKFSHYNYGVSASANMLDRKLYISGQIAQLLVHNGQPYDVNRSFVDFYLQAIYYVGNFNFSIAYTSENATDNYNSMSGIWTKNKDSFYVQAGWSNMYWNVRLAAVNLQRWNWRSSHDIMHSEYYSVSRRVSNASSHAFIQFSATYTFGFGKQVKQGNDISKQSGASSGILK